MLIAMFLVASVYTAYFPDTLSEVLELSLSADWPASPIPNSNTVVRELGYAAALIQSETNPI